MENIKKSDILTVLENIDKMLQCYTTMVNDIAGNMQMVAIAVEAQSLATKLSLAAERWKYKLPFKEACDVDFTFWEKKIEEWSEAIFIHERGEEIDVIDFFLPNTDHFIDQYYHEMVKLRIVDGERPFYMIDDSIEYEEMIWEYRDEIECGANDWNNLVDNAAIDELAENAFSCAEFFSQIKQNFADANGCLSEALCALSSALLRADKALLCPEEATYKSLYERLSVAYFDKHIDEAKTSFRSWLSKTPKKRRLKMLKEKLEKEKAKFFSGKWKEALEDYFDIEDIEKVLEGVDAGMFIFRYRRELTLEEVGQIVGQYHKMACIHSEIYRLENNEDFKPSASKEEAAKEEKTIQLPLIFASRIRESAKATNMIVETIRELALTTSIQDRKLSGGKTWGHVKEALCLLGFIDNECMGTEFGRAIEEICPDKKHANVEQVLKRYNSRKKTISDGNIIKEIKKMFEEVKSVNR